MSMIISHISGVIIMILGKARVIEEVNYVWIFMGSYNATI